MLGLQPSQHRQISHENPNRAKLYRDVFVLVRVGNARSLIMTIAPNRFSQGQPCLDSRSTWLVVCVTIASSYLVPTLVGMLVSNPQTVWPLWPGCAILVTGLLLVRVSLWPVLVGASFIG